MDPVNAKFYHSEIEIEFAGETLQLRGLVSEQGVTKIFLNRGLPESWRSAFGHELKIKVERLELTGVLLQQFVEHGSFFEIRFRNLTEPDRQVIRQRIQSEGISPGWRRAFPRIPVYPGLDTSLPVANLCMVRFVGQEVFVNVLNFTLGGIRIETMGDNLSELRVGSLISFDLITSEGEILANLNAEVRSLATHDNQRETGPTITRSFGLQFKAMDPVNEKKYRRLIRDYCLAIKQQVLGDGGSEGEEEEF